MGATRLEGMKMLQNLTRMKGMTIGATDGQIGRVRDAYFDDHEWTVRYLVVNPGSWLTVRRVLISPWSIRRIDWNARRVDVALTREQVRNSPTIDTDKPVSRQHESAYFDYYGYPYYWMGPFAWGPVPFPRETAATDSTRETEARSDEEGDPHLRSASEVDRYRIEAVDGTLGHVDGFIFDDESWALRYFVVDTRAWRPGGHVLVSTDWIERVSWEDKLVHVTLTRDEVRESPAYDPEAFTQSAADELEQRDRMLHDRSRRHAGRQQDRGADDTHWELPI